MSTDQDESEREEPAAFGAQAELLKSYLAFAKRAISRNRVASALVLLATIGLTITVAKYWPRTYHCEAKLMVDLNDALAGHGGTHSDVASLRGAANVIGRHENLEDIIKHTDLVHINPGRRPPILQLKDRISARLFGKVADEDAAKAFVWTLDTKLNVEANDQALTIGFDWTDPQTAMLLVKNALDNYLESRHTAEISAIAEYISILEGHATDMRKEVETYAGQVREARNQRRAEAKQRLKESRAAEPPPPPVVHRVAPSIKPVDDSAASAMRAAVETKKQAIADLEAIRQRRLTELQSQYDELKTRYTPAHPVMENLQQQISGLSQPSAQVTAMKAELRDLQAQEQKSTISTVVAGALAGSGLRAATAAPTPDSQLPDEIISLLNSTGEEDIDPALGAQFGYAVAKFSTLRTQISEARIELDTAQAAFIRRYKVVSPPEVPDKPIKPKVPVIMGFGLFAALMLGFLTAIGLELKRGKIIEHWQVQELALPILAELQFPPSSSNE